MAQSNGTPRPLRRTLRSDLRASLPDAAAALVLAGVAFALLAARVHAGVDAAVLEMPSMVQNGGVWPYSVSQALGWAALVWSWLTGLIGLSLPLLAAQRRPHWRDIAEQLHRSTSLTVVGLIVVHAVALVWDKMGDTLFTVFVPWTTAYLPGRFPETLGILSFYLALLFGPSFYFRDKLGPRTWRLLHRTVVPAIYILAVWHAFLYGSDVQVHNALWITLWLMQIPIAIAFAARLLMTRKRFPGQVF